MLNEEQSKRAEQTTRTIRRLFAADKSTSAKQFFGMIYELDDEAALTELMESTKGEAVRLRNKLDADLIGLIANTRGPQHGG